MERSKRRGGGRRRRISRRVLGRGCLLAQIAGKVARVVTLDAGPSVIVGNCGSVSWNGFCETSPWAWVFPTPRQNPGGCCSRAATTAAACSLSGWLPLNGYTPAGATWRRQATRRNTLHRQRLRGLVVWLRANHLDKSPIGEMALRAALPPITTPLMTQNHLR